MERVGSLCAVQNNRVTLIHSKEVSQKSTSLQIFYFYWCVCTYLSSNLCKTTQLLCISLLEYQGHINDPSHGFVTFPSPENREMRAETRDDASPGESFHQLTPSPFAFDFPGVLRRTTTTNC